MRALDITQLHHRYGERESLRGVSFGVQAGDLFALLGPNGSGKSTLFRILSTLLRPTSGGVEIFGVDALKAPAKARQQLGVVFQSPAVDPLLSVVENVRMHGYLFGLRGQPLARAMERVLERFTLTDRADDQVGTLSGGLRRRVELAKALLPSPRLLILDEPSTGLDPLARRDLLDELARVREEDGTTVVLTTHLMDEAAACGRVGILHDGQLVAIGSPEDLVATVGGDVIVIDPIGSSATLASGIEERFGLQTAVVEGRLRIERPRAHEFVATLVEAFPGAIATISVGRPTLDDVFAHHAGVGLSS